MEGSINILLNSFPQNVDEGILSESAPPPPFNYYNGETNNSIEQSDNLIEDDQKPAVGICQTSELPDGQRFFVLPDECGLRDRLVKHEYLAESSNDADANACDEVDAGDMDGRYVLNEPFFSTSDHLSFSDELLLESNELSNPTESDPAAFDVLEEYLTYFDADGDNADMSFDPSEILGTESPVPDEAVLSEVNIASFHDSFLLSFDVELLFTDSRHISLGRWCCYRTCISQQTYCRFTL